jgi:hypothetical protein
MNKGVYDIFVKLVEIFLGFDWLPKHVGVFETTKTFG